MNTEQKIKLVNKCRNLRARGFSLGEIASLIKIPKTTVYDYVEDVILTDEQRRQIEITGRNNLVKFWNEINFSSGIYINPRRKNSRWKEKIEKKKILELALKSYKIKDVGR